MGRTRKTPFQGASGGRGRKPGETRVNLNTHCYSAWRGETGKVCRSGANMNYSGCPRIVVSVWEEPPPTPTLAHAIRMPVETDFLPSFRRHTQKEKLDPVEPGSARKETRTAYIGHSKPRNSGTAAQAVYSIELFNQPRPTIHTVGPRKPLGQAG